MFTEFEIICSLSSWLQFEDTTIRAVYSTFVYTVRWSVKSHSPLHPLLFFSPCCNAFPLDHHLETPNLPFLPSTVLSLSPNLFPPSQFETDRAFRSSWRHSFCTVWSRSRHLPICPKVYLSVCLSSPAVALASHLVSRALRLNPQEQDIEPKHRNLQHPPLWHSYSNMAWQKFQRSMSYHSAHMYRSQVLFCPIYPLSNFFVHYSVHWSNIPKWR